uniref:Proteasome assembly chaperone 4 n=1 Tax=Canis lupus familiaris TaxID=9615 RepID=A0A8C0N322_CANLF
MEGPRAAAGGDVSLHNFSARLWEQLVHFHVMRLTDSLFLWVGATPHLRNLAVAMCNRYDSIPVSTSLLGDTSDTTSTGLAQRLGMYLWPVLQTQPDGEGPYCSMEPRGWSLQKERILLPREERRPLYVGPPLRRAYPCPRPVSGPACSPGQ